MAGSNRFGFARSTGRHQNRGLAGDRRQDTLYVAWQDQRAFSPEALSSPANADIFVSQRDRWSLDIPY